MFIIFIIYLTLLWRKLRKSNVIEFSTQKKKIKQERSTGRNGK